MRIDVANILVSGADIQSAHRTFVKAGPEPPLQIVQFGVTRLNPWYLHNGDLLPVADTAKPYEFIVTATAERSYPNLVGVSGMIALRACDQDNAPIGSRQEPGFELWANPEALVGKIIYGLGKPALDAVVQRQIPVRRAFTKLRHAS